MDDGRFRGAMVDQPPPAAPSPPEKPFALKSTVFTIGFLLVVLGVVPSVFFLIEYRLATDIPVGAIIQSFWSQFRTLVGLAVFTTGLAAYTFCSVWLIFHGKSPHVEFDPPKHFVATGPYRYVRNPVVITLILTAIGQAIYFASIGIGIFVVIGMIFAHYQVTKIEEPLLRKRFGESYEQFCRDVPRWIPKPPAS